MTVTLSLPALSLDFLPEPALALEPDGTILQANARAGIQIGPDLVGRMLQDLVNDEPERVTALLRSALGSTAPIFGALTVRGSGGPTRRQLQLARLTRDHDGPGAVLLIYNEAANERFTGLRRTVEQLQQLLIERERERARLETALEHNRLLFRELQHRVKNNMHLIGVLLRLSAQEHDTPEVRACIAAGMNRIQAITRTQEAIYEAREATQLQAGPFVARIVRGVAGGMVAGEGLSLDVADFMLDGEAAHNLALIVNELLTNALKYGRTDSSARVRVGLSACDGSGDCLLTVTDNGPGFDPASVTRSSGLALVTALVEQMDGRIAFNRPPRGGTEVEVLLPGAASVARPAAAPPVQRPTPS